MIPDQFALSIDASGLRCPMPLLKAKQGLSTLKPGEILQLTATDPSSLRDVQSFTALTRHVLLNVEQVGEKIIFILQKGDETAL